jgi:hypothetical protein
MSQEFVSVPREWLTQVSLMQMSHEELQDQAVEFLCEPCDEPVPPAGGDIQLPRPVMKLEAEKLLVRDGEYAVSFERPGWLQQCREKGGTFPLLPLDEIKPIIERLQAENAALQDRLTVADEQVDILSGGLRLMTSFGSGTNIAGVKTVAKQTLNRSGAVAFKADTPTPQ